MKKIDLIQLVIIGRIICSISNVICCKHIQQYILSKKEADPNDRLKRGLIFLIPYNENDITSNNNKNNREKPIVGLKEATNQLSNINKQAWQQPLKISLHFNNTLKRNPNITDNAEYLNREDHDYSYNHIKSTYNQKEIVKRLINSHKNTKNDKNNKDKNPITIIFGNKTNRSRRMSQKKYMCFCKEANCRGTQCFHEQAQQQYPWKNIYFPNVQEFVDSQYDEDMSTEKNDKYSITPTEPTKFNIPLESKINFDPRVTASNTNTEIKQQVLPNKNYSDPKTKIKQKEASPIYQYYPYEIPRDEVIYSEIIPIQKKYPATIDPQLELTNNYEPNKIGKINLSPDKNNHIYGHYTNPVFAEMTRPTVYDNENKINYNPNNDNYHSKEIKNINKSKPDINVQHLTTKIPLKSNNAYSLESNTLPQFKPSNDKINKEQLKNNNNIKENPENFKNKLKEINNEILLQNAIKKIINNFVPGKSQDLITNYGKENIFKLTNVNEENIHPEISENPILKNIFFTPEVENMIVDKTKNFLFGIIGSPPNNIQLIKNKLHDIIEKIFSPQKTIVTTTTDKNNPDSQWVTERVTLLKKSENVAALKDPSKKALDYIKSIINKLGIGEEDAKQPVIGNLIIKTVKHYLDKESGTIDESIIRQAFELLIHPNTENSSNSAPATKKISTEQTKKSVLLQPKFSLFSNENDYKKIPENIVKKHILQNEQLIEQQQKLIEKQEHKNSNFSENKKNVTQKNLDELKFKKLKSDSDFVNKNDEKIQNYNLNISNIDKDSRKLKVLSEESVDDIFSSKNTQNKYSETFESSERDYSIERKPIKYFSPNDRILEYIKNHQNFGNSKLKTVAEIIGRPNDYKINRTTHQDVEKIQTVNHNLLDVRKNPVNTLDYERSNLRSNTNQLDNSKEKENLKRNPIFTNNYRDEQQSFLKNPITLSAANKNLNFLVESNSLSPLDSRTPRNKESKIDIKTAEIKKLNKKFNDDQILDTPPNKFTSSLFQNEYALNSSLWQNLFYFGKFVPINEKQISDTQNENDLQESNLVYVGDGVRLPIKMKKMQDGTFALTLSNDAYKQFLFNNGSCCSSNVNKTVNLRERRSDETIPQLNFFSNQSNSKISAIDWFLETFDKAHNLIPNVAAHKQFLTMNQGSNNDNDELNINYNVNQILEESGKVDDTVTSKYEQIYTINDQDNKKIRDIQNKNIFDNILKNQLNNNAMTIKDDQINNFNISENIKNKIHHDPLLIKLESDTNESRKRNENIKKLKNKNKCNQMNDDNKINDCRNFETKFDYEMLNPIPHRSEQTNNYISPFSGGPPYKYQRYADEDMIVSRRIRTLKNVLHFMKDLIINTSQISL